VAVADADEVAYRRQFQALDPTDLEGHLNLATWCRDQEAWDLLKQQCKHVLRLDPDHTIAKLYLELAEKKLGSSTPDPGTGPNQNAGARPGNRNNGAPIRPLTKYEIQILRRAELSVDHPERVQVEFKNDVLDRFWDYMALRENLVPNARAGYNKLRPAAVKAQFIISKIREYKKLSTEENPFEDEFSEDIVIESDPALFREFKHPRVSGVILNTCATARCHGGTDAGEFTLYNERTMTDGMHYANYLVLHEYERDGERLINCDEPLDSLVLRYGQPKSTGPGTPHPTEVDVVFPNARNPKYQNLARWCMNLTVPAPNYGFSIAEPAEPPANTTN
jgi:hypothetical protein